MEKKILRAIRNLQKSTKTNPLSFFSFEDSQSGNSFRAKVFFNDNNLPQIEVSQNNGYQIDELVSKLETSVNTIFQSPLPYAKKGSKIYTRDTNFNVGDITQFDGQKRYYRIDSSPFYCGGETLNAEYTAKCIGIGIRANCIPNGSYMQEYTIFELS